MNQATDCVSADSIRAPRRSAIGLSSRRQSFRSEKLRLLFRSLTWSPSVALSWLWGLGFFYSIHVTIEDGWLGFLSFAAPNAGGLLLFGWFLGSDRRDPAKLVARIQNHYYGLFLIAQTLALAITIFCFVAYLWRPMFLSGAMTPVGLVVLLGCGVGHISSVTTIKRIHIVYLVVGVASATFALACLRGNVGRPPIPLASFSPRFYGLLLPIVVGLLLGPWIDIQQWQRATEIRRQGGSIRVAYCGGAMLFFALLTLNALLAEASGHVAFSVAADGIADAEPAVAAAIARSGLHSAAIAFALWGVIASISTVDSSYVAMRWMLTRIVASSQSPLLAFISAELVSSPLWVVLAAAAIAGSALVCNLSMMYLMAPFATLLAGSAASLVAESLGARGRYDPTFAYLAGLAASLVLLQGYLHSTPAFEAMAPLIALIGGAQTLADTSDRNAADRDRAAADLVSAMQEKPVGAWDGGAQQAARGSCGFRGNWFEMHVIPTYDDTSAVGNVYFANYIRWVGKARELFFNACMPHFDLSTTPYYIATRSFRHDFRREAKEFENMLVRVRIAEHNRKFVTLQHEIVSPKHGMIGQGEQSLMFIDAKDGRPLDIPRGIVEGFLPYWPKSSMHSEGHRNEAAARSQ